MHRSSVIANNRLYVFGGQQGDFIPVIGNPQFVCNNKTKEKYLADTYLFDFDKRQWQRVADMPVAASHTEFSVVMVDHDVLLVGGAVHKNHETCAVSLTDVIQVYHVKTNLWEIKGHLPYRVKTPIVAFLDGWLYAIAGQRDVGPDDARAGRIEARAWRTLLSLN